MPQRPASLSPEEYKAAWNRYRNYMHALRESQETINARAAIDAWLAVDSPRHRLDAAIAQLVREKRGHIGVPERPRAQAPGPARGGARAGASIEMPPLGDIDADGDQQMTDLG